MITSTPHVCVLRLDCPATCCAATCSGSNFKHLPMPTADCLIPAANGTMVTAKCYNAETAPKCSSNGDVKLPFGSPPYIGMGFMVSAPSLRVAAVWGGRPGTWLGGWLVGRVWACGWVGG